MFDPLNSKCVLCLEDIYPAKDNFIHSTSYCNLIEFANYIKAPFKDEVQQGKILISICTDCEHMIKAFNSTLKSLKIAQMKLDSCLKEIQDKMLKRKPNEMEDLNNIELINLRRNFIEKSSIRLKRSRSQPFVKLVNVAGKIKKETSCPSSEPFTITINVKTEPQLEGNEAEDFNGNHDHEDDQDDLKMEVDNCSDDVDINSADTGEVEDAELCEDDTARKKRKLVYKHCYCKYCNRLLRPNNIPQHEKKCVKNPEVLESKGPGKYISCPFCRAEFQKEKPKSRQLNRGSWMLRQHLLQYHCAHYFPSQKHESVTDSEYQKILVELLFNDLVEGKESCAFCPRTFLIAPKGSKKSAYHLRQKLHYVDAHYKNLEERLNDIQNDPDLKEKLRKCNPKGKECKLCGTYLAYPSRAVHQKLHCNKTEKEAFFIPNRPLRV